MDIVALRMGEAHQRTLPFNLHGKLAAVEEWGVVCREQWVFKDHFLLYIFVPQFQESLKALGIFYGLISAENGRVDGVCSSQRVLAFVIRLPQRFGVMKHSHVGFLHDRNSRLLFFHLLVFLLVLDCDEDKTQSLASWKNRTWPWKTEEKKTSFLLQNQSLLVPLFAWNGVAVHRRSSTNSLSHFPYQCCWSKYRSVSRREGSFLKVGGS